MTEIFNVERIEVSNQLMTAADKFLAESNAPIGPAAQAECARIAGMLATIGRALLSGQADYDRALAYVDAAERILDGVIARRKFLEAIRAEWPRA